MEYGIVYLLTNPYMPGLECTAEPTLLECTAEPTLLCPLTRNK